MRIVFVKLNKYSKAKHCLALKQVTMNMAEYGRRRSQQPANVNFEPIIRGLPSDIFD